MMDKEHKNWIEKRQRLIDYLMMAEDVVQYGSITINYRAGQITSCDTHKTIRTKAPEEGKAEDEDI